MTGFKPRLQHGYGRVLKLRPLLIPSHEPMLIPEIIGTNKAPKETKLVSRENAVRDAPMHGSCMAPSRYSSLSSSLVHFPSLGRCSAMEWVVEYRFLSSPPIWALPLLWSMAMPLVTTVKKWLLDQGSSFPIWKAV